MKRLLFLVLVACSELTAPEGAVLIDPIPAAYRVWWAEMEKCSGFRGDLNAVEFYAVPYFDGIISGRSEWSGRNSLVWFVAHMTEDERLVKHEMMHVLGKFTTHPPKYFNGVCGNLMGGPHP